MCQKQLCESNISRKDSNQRPASLLKILLLQYGFLILSAVLNAQVEPLVLMGELYQILFTSVLTSFIQLTLHNNLYLAPVIKKLSLMCFKIDKNN